MVVTTITIDKSLPIVSKIRPVDGESEITEKTVDQEWTEPKIQLKDLHQHYLKLCKSRLTSKNMRFSNN